MMEQEQARQRAPYQAGPSHDGEAGVLIRRGDRIALGWYAIAKQVPDLLTLMRLVLALILFGLALAGQAQPGRDIWLLVAGWATDMTDGHFSRTLKKKRRLAGLHLVWPVAVSRRVEAVKGYYIRQKANNTSWLGRHDVYVDMLVSLAVLGYLAVTSLIPLWAALAYLGVWGMLFLRWGIPDVFAQIFQNPIYAAFVYLTVWSAPWVLPWLLLFAAAALLLFWRRLLQLWKNLYRAARG